MHNYSTSLDHALAKIVMIPQAFPVVTDPLEGFWKEYLFLTPTNVKSDEKIIVKILFSSMKELSF